MYNSIYNSGWNDDFTPRRHGNDGEGLGNPKWPNSSVRGRRNGRWVAKHHGTFHLELIILGQRQQFPVAVVRCAPGDRWGDLSNFFLVKNTTCLNIFTISSKHALIHFHKIPNFWWWNDTSEWGPGTVDTGPLRDPYCRGVGSHAALRPDPTAVAATHGVPGPAG